MFKIGGKSSTLFPEKKWVKRIPFLILGYTLAMLLLGNAVASSSILIQHVYIYLYGFGFMFLILLFIALWKKSQIRTVRPDGNSIDYKKKQ